jgi:hypothetical protein
LKKGLHQALGSRPCGVARRRASYFGRAEILPPQPADRCRYCRMYQNHQGPMGLRAGASADLGGTRLGHVEGRSWTRLHRPPALMAMIASLQRRLKAGGKKEPTTGHLSRPYLLSDARSRQPRRCSIRGRTGKNRSYAWHPARGWTGLGSTGKLHPSFQIAMAWEKEDGCVPPEAEFLLARVRVLSFDPELKLKIVCKSARDDK